MAGTWVVTKFRLSCRSGCPKAQIVLELWLPRNSGSAGAPLVAKLRSSRSWVQVILELPPPPPSTHTFRLSWSWGWGVGGWGVAPFFQFFQTQGHLSLVVSTATASTPLALAPPSSSTHTHRDTSVQSSAQRQPAHHLHLPLPPPPHTHTQGHLSLVVSTATASTCRHTTSRGRTSCTSPPAQECLSTRPAACSTASSPSWRTGHQGAARGSPSRG